MQIKLIVAGSRGFSDYSLLCKKLDYFLGRVSSEDEVTIIGGTARGADTMGEQYAKERGYAVERMPADWERYGKSAGYRRNEEMAKVATHCVLFWDQVSRGTKHMADIADRHNIPTRIVRYTSDPGDVTDLEKKWIGSLSH
jgi:hypothetical protein